MDPTQASENEQREQESETARTSEALDRLFDLALRGETSPQQLADEVLQLIKQNVNSCSNDRDGSFPSQRDTPGLEEMGWEVWRLVDISARQDRSHHDLLVAFINHFFPLLRTQPWILWGCSMKDSDFILGATFRESYRGTVYPYRRGEFPSASHATSSDEEDFGEKSWINYCRFVARMTRDTSKDFSLYLLWFARDALEDCSWVTCFYPHAAVLAFEQVMDVCGELMFLCDTEFGKAGSGGDGVRKWEGKSGFCKERWMFWEQGLHQISEDESGYPLHVRDSAHRTLSMMASIRKRIHGNENPII